MKTKRLILSLGVAAVVSSVLFAQSNTTVVWTRDLEEIGFEAASMSANQMDRGRSSVGYSVSEGEARDVVDAVLFLLRSPFVTGQTIFVDGGRHLRGSMYG